MRTFEAEKHTTIPLGKRGENSATEILFDVSDFLKYGENGTFALLHQRSEDNVPYPAAFEMEGNIITWTIKAAETAYSGVGRCELQYLIDDVVVKSRTWFTKVHTSLDDPIDIDEPESSWLASFLEKINSIISDNIDSSGMTEAIAEYLAENHIESIEIATDEEVSEMLTEIFG